MRQNLQAGAAAVVIMPPLGVSLVGSYSGRRAETILSDLYAKALVLDDGATPVAIVTLDLCFIAPEVAAQARVRVERLTGIPAARVMLTCTHTHAGPATSSSAFAEADPSYIDLLVRRIGDAVALAQQRRHDARLLVGHGHEASISFNRRYWMRDGTLRTNPPFQSPDIVRPGGPVDPEVGVLRVEDMAGRLIALLVNFALHVAIVAGTAFSADYPGVLSEIVQKLEGPDAAVLFAIGCCGDINHFDMSKPGPQSGQAVAERIGTVLAGEVLKVMTRLVPVSNGGQIAFADKEVEMPLRVPTAQEVTWAQERRSAEMHAMDAAGLEVVAAHRILGVHGRGRAALPARVQALAIGDLAYVTLPGEIFVELGQAIKDRSPFTHTLIGELNGTFGGYIPTRKAYEEGGYEVTSSSVQPGSGEMLVETALELLQSRARPMAVPS